MSNKVWYKSKVLWFNIISIALIAIQGNVGFVIAPEIQVTLVSICNLLLRAMTTTNLTIEKK